MSRSMRDRKGHATRLKDSLWRYATGMKDGNFGGGVNVHSVAPFRFVDVPYTNDGGATHANRAAVGMRVLGSDFDVTCNEATGDGFHANHHVSAEEENRQ